MSQPARESPDSIEVFVTGFAHDGRGVASADGKRVLIDGALAGERVRIRRTRRHRQFDEAVVIAVERAAPQRVTPPCPHFGVCGGCSLQHIAPEAQVAIKQDALLEQLERIGGVAPDEVLAPITGPPWHYRRRARLTARYVNKKGRVLVGFRERASRYVADCRQCEVLDERVAFLLEPLAELVQGLSTAAKMPQIEIAAGDETVALVFRELAPMTEDDRERLRAFGAAHQIAIYLQPGGPETAYPLAPQAPELAYTLADHDVRIQFEPVDFVQVNAAANAALVNRALELLAPQPGERFLDLYCGIGNFSLPLARRAGAVIGVEGEAGLVQRAAANAARNGIDNAEFHVADLEHDFRGAAWLGAPIDGVLIDPPRTGAATVVKTIGPLRPKRIVYVSCHPATLARDADVLVHEFGYRLRAAGIADMFPHTRHVESIALME